MTFWEILSHWCVFLLLVAPLALSCGCADDNTDSANDSSIQDDDSIEDETTNDEACITCGSTFECTLALGTGWACRGGCCENLGPSDDDDDNDNDSQGDDVPLPSNEIGLFVSPIGLDSAPGTMEQPMRTIYRTAIKAFNQGKAVFVGRGVYQETVRTRVSLYGGYEELGWTRDIDAFVSEIRAPPNGAAVYVPGSFEGSLTVDGFTIRATFYNGSAMGANFDGGIITFRRNKMPGFFHIHIPLDWPFEWPSFYLDNLLVGQVEEAYIIDNEIEAFSVIGILGNSVSRSATVTTRSGKVLITGNRIEAPYLDFSHSSSALAVAVGSNCTMVNNIIELPLGCGATGVHNSGTLTMVHNTVLAHPGAGIGVNLYLGRTKLVNNIIQSGFGAVLFFDSEYGMPTVKMAGNDLLSHSDGPLVQIDDAPYYNIHEINACGFAGCLEAYDNITEDPQFVGSGNPHLLPGSPCVDSGVDPSPWVDTTLLDLDFEGDPRPSGSGWDMGADELVY